MAVTILPAIFWWFIFAMIYRLAVEKRNINLINIWQQLTTHHMLFFSNLVIKVQHVFWWGIKTVGFNWESVFSIQVLCLTLSSTKYAFISKLVWLALTKTFDENRVISYLSVLTTLRI